MGKLCRSKDKAIAGVCAGVAEFFGFNVRNVRLLWLVLTFIGIGSPLLFYVLLWFLMPDAAAKSESYEERMRKRLGR